MVSGAAEDDEDEEEPVARGRPRRAAQQSRVKAKTLSGKHTEGYDSLGSMDDESDATSTGNEWDGGDEDEPDDRVDDEEEDEDVDMSDNSVAEEEDDSRQSLVVSLRYLKNRPSPPRQDTATSKDHSIPPMTTNNAKEPSEMAYSIDFPTKSLNDAPKTTQDAVHTQHSRSTQQYPPFHHAVLTEHVAPVQYVAPTGPQTQVRHFDQKTPVASERDHAPYHPSHSKREEHPTPTASWPRLETNVVEPSGTQM